MVLKRNYLRLLVVIFHTYHVKHIAVTLAAIEHSCNASVIVREMFDILYCKHFLRLFIFSLKNLLFTLLPQTNQFRFTRIVTLTIKQSNYR